MLITISDVAETVAAKFRVTPEQLRGASRCYSIAHPRWVLMLLAKEETANSYSQIARYLGKDHTSVMHGYRRAQELAGADPEYAGAIASCRDMLASKTSWKARAARSVREYGLAKYSVSDPPSSRVGR